MIFDIVKIKSQVVDACRRLWERNLVANHDGNITFRIDHDRFIATPTAFSKRDVTVDDLIVVSSDGKVLEGNQKVFSEVFQHFAIYRARPEITCVVHAHPPTASAFGIAKKDIGTPSIPEAVVSLGRSILTSQFFSPLDPLLKQIGSPFEVEMKRVLAESDGFVAPGNGAWTVGEEVIQTYLRMELLEHVARQQILARELGNEMTLPNQLVDELVQKRPQRMSKLRSEINRENSGLTREDIKNVVMSEITQFLQD